MTSEQLFEILRVCTGGGEALVARARDFVSRRPGLGPVPVTCLLALDGALGVEDAKVVLGAVAARRRSLSADFTGRQLGKFRLTGRLRPDAQATYRADHLTLDRGAAVKIFEGDEERLRSGAVRLGRLSHPQVAALLDHGLEQGVGYLASAFEPGTSLEDVALPNAGRWLTAKRWLSETATALESAHRAGVTHGDLKPRNILVPGEGPVRLVGFSAGDPPGAGAVPAPEVLRGETGDARSDLYALGATFYHLLARRPPFDAGSLVELALRQDREEPSPDPLLRVGVPPALCNAILGLLKRDPAARIPSAAALVAMLGEKGQAAPAPPRRSARAAEPLGPKAGNRRPVIAALGAGVGLGLIALVALLAGGGGPPPEPPPAPPAPAPSRDDRLARREGLIREVDRLSEAGLPEEALRELSRAEAIEGGPATERKRGELEAMLRDRARHKAEFERLEKALVVLREEAALKACDDFLTRLPGSPYAERVLLWKSDISKAIASPRPRAEPSSSPPPPPPGPPEEKPASPPPAPRVPMPAGAPSLPKPGVPGRPLPGNIRGALLWLARHQFPEGCWEVTGYVKQCGGEKCTPNPGDASNEVGVTSLALLAFLAAGFGPEDQDEYDGINLGTTVRRGVAFLLESQGSDGCIGPRVEKVMYGQAYAVQALAEAKRAYAAEDAAAERVKQALENGTRHLLAAQNPKRGWRYLPRNGPSDTSVTTAVVLALEAARRAGARVPEEAFLSAAAFVKEVTEEGHARVGYTHRGTGKIFIPGVNEQYEHHETLTAAGWISRLVAAPRERQGSGAAADLLLRDRPKGDGYLIDYYYWHYGTRFLKALGETRKWEAWRESLLAALTATQVGAPGKCSQGSWRPEDRWALNGGRVFATALNLLTLLHATRDHPFPVRTVTAPTDLKASPADYRHWVRLKSGGRIRVLSYEAQGEKIILKLPGGTTTVDREGVEKIEPYKPD